MEDKDKTTRTSKPRQGDQTTDSGDIVVKVEFSEDEKANATLREGRVSEYTIPKKNVNDYTVHVEIEQVDSKVVGGKIVKRSHPTVIRLNKETWAKFRTVARLQGYTHVRVLYAPAGIDTTVVELNARGEAKVVESKNQ